jgi:hypothetical protein
VASSLERDPGYGPAPGNPTGPARGGGVPFGDLVRRQMAGLDVPTITDPAFAGKVVDATDGDTRARAKLIYRDVPLVTIQNTWSIEEARAAVWAHLNGIFYTSGQLWESILGDDRVTSTLNSRASAIFGREVRFKAADDSAAARDVCNAWERWWPRLSGTAAIREMFDYGIGMGFSHGQLCWDTTQPGLDFAPRLFPWHPVYEWYDWDSRCFQAIGSDAQIPIIPGNGKWVEFSHFMSYRAWIHGALRPVVEPWMLRHFGFRDMARFGEVHGSPTRKGYVPMVGDPIERAEFESSLARLGANTAIIVPRGVDQNDGLGYDYDLVEATSTAWQVHPGQIDRCDMAIVLALLMVNLETQVDGGGAWGAKSKMDVRSEGAMLDNASWKRTIYTDIARPFAYLNAGDANLAPWTWWDVVGRETYADNAKQLQAVSTGYAALRQAGVKFKDAEKVRVWFGEKFGLSDMPEFELGDPVAKGGAVSGGPGGEPPPGTPPRGPGK